MKRLKNDYSKFYPLIFALIFIIILFQYSFSSLEAIFYDLRVKLDFGIPADNSDIVVVYMDEESDSFLGENYPYSFASHSKMVTKLIQDGPAVINYIVQMLEPEFESERGFEKSFRESIEQYQALGGKFRFGTLMDRWGEQLPPVDLRTLGSSLALINQDNIAFSKDDVSRRMLLTISGEESLHLWTANAYRQMHGLDPIDSNKLFGSYYLREADATFALFRYSTSPEDDKTKIKSIPYHRVLVGNYPVGFFKNKIVFVGSRYISKNDDYVLTPFNKEKYSSSKLNLHAIITKALVEKKTAYMVPREVSHILSIIIAIILSLTIAGAKPTRGLFITVSVVGAILLVSQILFSVFGLWIYLSHIVLTVFVVYYFQWPFKAIIEYQRRFAIQEETKLLKKVESLKQNFISLMSHDLKTPVAKIAGIADVLYHQNNSNPVLQKDLLTIVDSTKELNSFITSILDLTKIESSNLTLNKSSKDINQLIENVVESLKYEAQKNEMSVECSLAPLYPIEIDTVLLKRVISNLVGNAIKYAGKGKCINIKTWDDAEWVYVEVRDNGIGVAKEDLEHIFDKFYRVKNDTTHSIKGTGLGLFLVKYFVELHGGTINVESELGKGTVFTVKLKNV